MRKKKRHADDSEVKLNLAAMLDMAFQLLTFFILTFRSPPVEGQVTLRLPKPEAIKTAPGGEKAGNDRNNDAAPIGVETLTISVTASQTGAIESMAVGDGGVGTVGQLETRLKVILADPSTDFKQVIIQAGSKLRYDQLMSIVDVCTRQTLNTGEKLTKLSFVELPDGGS